MRHEEIVTEIAWSPDGRRLAATAVANRSVILWDIAKDRLIRRQDKASAIPPTIGFSPDGRSLISSSFHDRDDDHPTSFTVLDGLTGEVVHHVPGPDLALPFRRFWPIYAVAADPTGPYMAMLFGIGPHAIALYDQQSWQPRRILLNPAPPVAGRPARVAVTYRGRMRFGPDGRWFALMGVAWEKGENFGGQVVDVMAVNFRRRKETN